MERGTNRLADLHSSQGKLVLTRKHLVYQPQGWTIHLRGKHIRGGEEMIIELRDIKDISKKQTSFGMSKQIWITYGEGHLERFVVWQRDEFIEAVKKQMESNKSITTF